MKRKNFIIATLVLVALIVSGFTFAYWASGAGKGDKDDNITIEIGTAGEVATTIDLSKTGSGVLVPAGRGESGQVEEVELTFTVEWKATNSGANDTVGELVVSVETGSVKINDAVTHAGLVNILLPAAKDITLNGASIEVVVKVTLTEPATEAIYDAIAGKNITFTLNFAIEEK